MGEEELDTILTAHKLWLTTDTQEGRANLRGADLTGANLTDANLTGANLSGADLTRANLSCSDLRCADLTDADLTRADLTGANLRDADLHRANLTDADLTGANLTGACGRFSTFYGGNHHAWATCSHIVIGCKKHTHAEWREQYAKIEAENDYSIEEIERYRAWIFSLDWLMEDK